MATGSKLVIVESPTKAKKIGGYLGSGYTVMASVGHIRDLAQPSQVPAAEKAKYGKFGVDIEDGFKPYYIVDGNKKKTVADLKSALKKADTLYLATDEDREGEAIAWHLVQTLKPKVPVKRMVFHEITPEAIKASLNNTRDVDAAMVDAQETRRILDRLYGYELSPVLWRKVGPGLSAGRVQSVAVRMVDDREKEIQAFEAQEYWTLDADLTDEATHKTFEAHYYGKDGKKVEPTSGEQVDGIIADIGDKSFTVTNIKRTDKQRSPSLPFTTSTLQQEASRKLNMTPRRTMAIAQQLYEGIDISGEGTVGLITYMIVPLLVILFSVMPVTTQKIVAFFIRILGKMRIIKNVENTIEKACGRLEEYNIHMRQMKKNKGLYLAIFFFSLLFQIALNSIPFFVLCAFGVKTSFYDMFSLCAITYAAVSFVPTPGNGGAAEGMFMVIFRALSGGVLFWGMLIWRILSYYAFIVVGAMVTVVRSYLDKRKRQQITEE